MYQPIAESSKHEIILYSDELFLFEIVS